MKVWLSALLLLLAAPLQGHELLSASLQLEEIAPDEVRAMLKVPLARDGSPATVLPALQPDCEMLGPARATRGDDAVLREWRMRCAGGLIGRSLRMHGLDPRTPDAVVVVRLADGTVMTRAVDRHDPFVALDSDVATAPGLLEYLPIGIEHILLGPDHLLFVFGLMLVVLVSPLPLGERDRVRGKAFRSLLVTITAFTVAHSLTLALAVLGIWGLPAKAVELLIALSIVLLAVELARRELQPDQPATLTLRKPWMVAFVFGLLHGFGFAGALAEVGLPEAARGWALFLFNVGVEIGQLMFVTLMLLLLALLRRIPRAMSFTSGRATLVTALGGIAMYWTLDRLLLWSAKLVGA